MVLLWEEECWCVADCWRQEKQRAGGTFRWVKWMRGRRGERKRKQRQNRLMGSTVDTYDTLQSILTQTTVVV